MTAPGVGPRSAALAAAVARRGAEPSSWTAESVIERLAAAAETLRRLPDPARGPSRLSSRWPDILRRTVESFNTEAERAAFHRAAAHAPADAREIDLLEETLTWISWIEGDLQKLIWLRACGVRWWRLELRQWRLRTQRRRYERKTLAFHYKRGIAAIVSRLNAEAAAA